MALTDLELKALSQIAYYDLELWHTEADGKISVYDALSEKERDTLRSYGIEDWQLRSWQILEVHNDNGANGTGFFACVIEVYPGEAAVAFRGSEKLNDLNDVAQDWVGADLGLLNSTMTEQQGELRRFFTDNKSWLDKYKLIPVGHSLGGNLSEYATIISEEYGLDDNIIQCASLDGPGFSQEFIDEYGPQIEKMSGVMYHPRWSWVGALLQDLPGVNYRYIEVENSDRSDGEYNSFTRHSLVYVKQDENNSNSFVDGEQDVLSKHTELMTEGIDHLPAPIGNVLVTVVGGIWIGIMWAKDNFFDENGNIDITSTGWGIIAGIVGIFAIFEFSTVITTVFAVVVAVLAVLVVSLVAEFIYELVLDVVDMICDVVANIYNWAKETYQQFKAMVKSFIDKVRNWYNNNLNYGYKYATSNPQVVVDTYKLKEYAQRLWTVNSRIGKLDGRLDSLYWEVGLLDLWDLMKADLLTGYSWRLQRAANYLNDTAFDFERAETELSGI